MSIENTIESCYREIQSYENQEYIGLYSTVEDNSLQIIFSTLHYLLNTEFKAMNSRLPTTNTTAHFWAANSRNLINAIELSFDLQKKLSNSKFEFALENYYEKKMNGCLLFLNKYLGSPIPENTNKIELIYVEPIFIMKSSNNFKKKNGATYPLSPIGSGAFANVYKYNDEDYDEIFAYKRLKDSVDGKDIVRFKQEFELMKKYSHPNLIKVYKFFDNNSYTMEYGGLSLKKFMDANNQKLTENQRMNLINQLLVAIKFLHKNNILHRDISFNNILIKNYNEEHYLKVNDFGLAKDLNNNLTSTSSEIKGTFIDPCLVSFKEYNIKNELYSIGRMINYIYFGKVGVIKGDKKISTIIEKCVSIDLNQRYENVNALINDIYGNSKMNLYKEFNVQQLKNLIVSDLTNYSANELPSICNGIGLDKGEISEAFKSKRLYVSNRLNTLNRNQTIELINRIKDNFGYDITENNNGHN